MVHDLRSLIANSKLRRPFSRLIERKLRAAIDLHITQCDAGEFVEFLARGSPIYGAYHGSKGRILRVLMKELRWSTARSNTAMQSSPVSLDE